MNNTFCYLLRTRYSECDAQKVVFNSRYADYLDVAVTEFMRVIWGNYNDLLAQGVDNQMVSYAIDWQSSACFDEVIAISVSTVHIGNTSYTLQVEFTNHETGAKVATAKVIYVMVDAVLQTKMAIPKDLRAPLELGATGYTVDHASVSIGV